MSVKAARPACSGGEDVGEHHQPVHLAEGGRDQVAPHRVPVGVVAGRQQAGEAGAAGQGEKSGPGRLRAGGRHQETAGLQE